MIKYIVLQLADNSATYCNYATGMTSLVMPLDVFKSAVDYSWKLNANIHLLLPDYDLGPEYNNYIYDPHCVRISNCGSVYEPNSDIIVLSSPEILESANLYDNKIYIVHVDSSDISKLRYITEYVLSKVLRINIVIDNICNLSNDFFSEYKDCLLNLNNELYASYLNGNSPQINIITDRIHLTSMNNCNAGVDNFCIAPNGLFYLCPAFYRYSCEPIGNLLSGLSIPNQYLLEYSNAPICKVCDSYHCRRCVYLNHFFTEELNTPSHEQCVISHIERSASIQLLRMLKNVDGNYHTLKDIPELNYDDPIGVILNKK